jgi:hypothetical protein
MRHLSWRALISTLATGLLLAGCGGSGGGDGGHATIRLVNLTTSNSAFDLVDADEDETLASTVAADQASTRASCAAPATTVRWSPRAGR